MMRNALCIGLAVLPACAALQVACSRPACVQRRPTHLSARASGVLMMDAAEELKKLQTALAGLKEDGFPAEALAPLEAQIAACELKAAAEEAQPPRNPDPPARKPDPRSRPTAAADELKKLQATLAGLKDDGFDTEALAPLEAQIAACELK